MYMYMYIIALLVHCSCTILYWCVSFSPLSNSSTRGSGSEWGYPVGVFMVMSTLGGYPIKDVTTCSLTARSSFGRKLGGEVTALWRPRLIITKWERV